MTTKPFAFVIMPFDDKFKDIYEFGIKEPCNEEGFYCERVDEQIFQGNILQRIFNQISKADLIIADMSEKNPNVFFEAGYAEALGKKIIFITNDIKDIPFDLKHHKHIEYKSASSLKKEIKTILNWIMNNENSANIPEFSKLHLFCRGKEINQFKKLKINVEYNHNRGLLDLDSLLISLKIDINNFSDKIINSDFRIAIETKSFKHKEIKDDCFIVDLPGKKYINFSQNFKKIYPKNWISCFFDLVCTTHGANDFADILKEDEFKIYIYNELGMLEYPCKIILEFPPLLFK